LTKVQSELTTLKSKRLMVLFWWILIGILFGNPSKHNGKEPKKSKIQENLDTQNAAFHLLNYCLRAVESNGTFDWKK
jgi:hypothetical protein